MTVNYNWLNAPFTRRNLTSAIYALEDLCASEDGRDFSDHPLGIYFRGDGDQFQFIVIEGDEGIADGMVADGWRVMVSN